MGTHLLHMLKGTPYPFSLYSPVLRDNFHLSFIENFPLAIFLAPTLYLTRKITSLSATNLDDFQRTSYMLLVCVCVCILVTQLSSNLWSPTDCSPPGSSAHGILQAIILEWVVISFSRGSFQPRDRIWVSCIASRLFTVWVSRKALLTCRTM